MNVLIGSKLLTTVSSLLTQCGLKRDIPVSTYEQVRICSLCRSLRILLSQSQLVEGVGNCDVGSKQLQ